MPSQKSSGFEYKEIPFDGKLITAVDPARIGTHFRDIQNLRYTDGTPEAIGGMSKINTSAISTYLKVRNGYHFSKIFPVVESHILVQGYNTGLTASRVLQNTTTIPSQGNFSGTSLHTDASGASRGYFSEAPGGMLAYCNSKESLLWGGDEFRCAGFVNYNPDGTFKYDFTDVINNTLTDSQNIAALRTVDPAIDSNTMLLLSLDNNVTDTSPATPHTITNNNVTFSTGTKVFGTHSAVFNGSSAYLTAPDNADFDFSGGIWTYDFRGYLDDLSDSTIFYQQTDANNWIRARIFASGVIQLQVYTASALKVNVATNPFVLSAGQYYHIEIVENGNDWYIFVNGVQRAYVNDADRALNYTGLFQIGYDGSDYYSGYMDEIRVSNVARHTNEFEIPASAYADTGNQAFIYVGSTQPLQGIKLYSETANASTSTMQVFYWSGTAWVEVSNISDGTASGGVSLAQTGSVTFDDTAALTKIKLIDQVSLYWYKIYIDDVDDGTAISRCSVDAAFQSIKDIWDGEERICLSFQVYANSTFNDNTINVFDEDYSSANTATFAELDTLATATDYIVAGFDEKQQGLDVTLVGGAVNTTAGTLLTISYWNGAAWVSVGDITDGTKEGTLSFAKSGIISWNPQDQNIEFKREIANEFPLYYYKLAFSENLSADVKLDFVGGIPAPEIISAYKFPVYAHSRLFLCSNQDSKKNTARVSAAEVANVFNGEDSVELSFGDEQELTAGVGMFRQYGSTLYNLTVITKATETWVLVGNGPDDWRQYPASNVVGCVAPLTLKVAHVNFEVVSGQNRYIAIYQSANGIHLFDGSVVQPIHEDIKDVFDQRKSTAINPDMIGESVGFFDNFNQEYHWLYAEGSSTTLNKEKVYDLKRQRWYNTNRTSAKALQAGITVRDTDDNNYNYGFIDTGYMERLENGTDFDGADIACVLDMGDVNLSEGLSTEVTQIRAMKLIQVAKTNTSNSALVTHYGDTASTGTALSFSPIAANKRISQVTQSTKLGPFCYHRFKLALTTDDETIGFEPLALAVAFKTIRQELK